MQTKKHNHHKQQRFADVPHLIERIQQQSPPSGEYFYDYKLEEAKKDQTILDEEQFHTKYKINFGDLPISKATYRGLTQKGFKKMTEVQRCTIPHALAGRDILAASRTGSGKTLAYLVPLVQKLYREKFIPLDGLGALVIVPVRQLAMQVFEVLNSFTYSMELNIGLIIGGKDVNYEKERIQGMNILICTPGRLLQHLQQTYNFETTNLKMLVLDEADVMMQMGFKEKLKAIMENLPKCQTLLFSATLNKAIYSLAQLSMNDPQRIFLHSVTKNKGQVMDQFSYQTPSKLTQYYMLVNPQEKLNTLYSFLKTHQKQKILIFVATCKEARFLYEAFKKFRFGCPIYEIQGHQKQKKRMAIYFTFSEKRYGILISTNIASRGLDFPMIDWVIQFDIPEDTETYVHRVGRTARYKADGKALTFVNHSEKQFVKQLKQKKIPIHKITQNPHKYFSIESSLRSICSEHQDIKYLAQRALISYLKFIYKAPNKQYFDLKAIDTTKLSQSFGLLNAPTININNKQQQHSEGDEQEQKAPQMSKIQKLRMKKKLKTQEKKAKMAEKEFQKKEHLSEEQQEVEQEEQNQFKSKFSSRNNDDQPLFKPKKLHTADPNEKPILTTSKRQLSKVKPHGHFDGKNIIHFDDNLNPITDEEFRRQKYLQQNKKPQSLNNMQIIQQRLYQNEQQDRLAQLNRRKQRRRKLKTSKQQARGHGSKKVAVLNADDQEFQEEE